MHSRCSSGEKKSEGTAGALLVESEEADDAE
jgi:hypothetical protein